MLWPSKLSQVK